MAIKQVIKYSSDSKYFAGFLQAMIKESGIVGSVSQSDDSIVLRLEDNDESRVAEFGEISAKYLPHSIFLGDVKTINVQTHSFDTDYESPTYNISVCQRCLEELTDPSSQRYLDDSLKCQHYSNADAMEYQDTKYYSPHYSQNSNLLVVNPNSVNRLFLMTQDEVKALFSIEKPTLKVTIKDETLKELTGKKFINIKSPHTVKSNLVALNARESEIEYLFFEKSEDLEVVIVQDSMSVIRDTRGVSKKLLKLDEDTVINRFLNISKEAEFESSLGVTLSSSNGISFLLNKQNSVKKVINFQEFRLGEVLMLMKSNETKSRLLDNFSKKYPEVSKELEENENYGLFETIASILELREKSFDGVSDKSLEFHGNGGLKIDVNYSDDGFDYPSFIGSIMSFKLADTQESYLAYSIFEALGDMSITTLSQLKAKFKINHFVIMGDMFQNSVLYSRILSKFELNKPYFSKGFALDD